MPSVLSISGLCQPAPRRSRSRFIGCIHDPSKILIAVKRPFHEASDLLIIPFSSQSAFKFILVEPSQLIVPVSRSSTSSWSYLIRRHNSSQSRSVFQLAATTCCGIDSSGNDDDQHCRSGSRFTLCAVRECVSNSLPRRPKRDSTTGESWVQKGRINSHPVFVTAGLILSLVARSVRWTSGRRISRKVESISSRGELVTLTPTLGRSTSDR